MKLDRLWPYLDEQPDEGADAAGAEVPDDETPEVDASAESASSDDGDDESEGGESEQSLLDLIKGEGLELDAEDDFSAAKALMEQAKSAKAYQQQLADLEHRRQYEAYLAAQQAQPQQQLPPKNPYEVIPDNSILKHWKQKPEFNPRWLSMVQRDEKGNLVPVSGADPTLPAKVAQYIEWQRDANELIASDPVRLVTEAMYANPEISSAISTMIEQRVSSAIAEIKAQQIAEKAVSELFETDANGKPIKKNGSFVPNNVGKAYMQFVTQLSQQGINDPERQYQMALLMAKGAVGATPAKATEKKSPTESKAESRFKWQKNSAAKAPKRSGSSSGSAKSVISSTNELYDELVRQLSGS